MGSPAKKIKKHGETEGMDKEFYTVIMAELSNDDIEAKIYTEVKGEMFQTERIVSAKFLRQERPITFLNFLIK